MSMRRFVTAPGIQSVLKTLPRYAVRYTSTFEATGPKSSFDNKEKALEDYHFRRADESRTMRLLEKMQAEERVQLQHDAREALTSILGPLPEEVMEQLLVWKDQYARPAHMAPYIAMVSPKMTARPPAV